MPKPTTKILPSADEMARLPASERIRYRLVGAKCRYHANDNIAAFIKDGEVDELKAEVQQHMQAVLQALVIDTESDHNTGDTAKRVARMFIDEVFRGRYVKPPTVTEFPNASHLNELMIVGPVRVRSACSHHLCPILGKVWIGIMPNEHSNLIGLSKYARICDWVMTPAADSGRGGDHARRRVARACQARRPGHRDGGRPFLHALARGQG